jgi:hypothetical protein
MPINIDHLNETELIQLNERIVQRLRMMNQMRAHMRMMDFTLGERVWFQADDGKTIRGVLVRYNKKSVTVITDEGLRWTVSPSFLRKAEAASSGRQDGHIVEMRKTATRE